MGHKLDRAEICWHKLGKMFEVDFQLQTSSPTPQKSYPRFGALGQLFKIPPFPPKNLHSAGGPLRCAGAHTLLGPKFKKAMGDQLFPQTAINTKAPSNFNLNDCK